MTKTPVKKKAAGSKELDLAGTTGQPEFGVKSYGDPVIVDDGGSIRISAHKIQLHGLATSAKQASVSSWAGARLTVFAATSGGPYATALLLTSGDRVDIVSSGSTITLTFASGSLTVSSTQVASEHSHGPDYGYHYAGTQPIISVTHTASGGAAFGLVNPRMGPTSTFVCVERQT